ncbi:MAG: flagellar hook basal-body protein [Mariprofundaceae bacterium]
MQQGFFISGVSGQMAQHKMDNISHNLANINTVGYLSDQISFQTVLTNNHAVSGSPELAPAAYLAPSSQYINVEEGAARETGNDLDFAIHGNAFFRVKTDGGEEAYSRAGNFVLGEDGILLTQGGLSVLDDTGNEIRLPSGRIDVTELGAISVDGERVGQFGLVSITDPTKMRKLDGVLLTTDKNNTGEVGAGARLYQGMVNSANVNAIQLMAEMTNTLRNYQSMMKMIEEYGRQASLVSDRVGIING